jgi:hypothetical protein
MKKLIVLLLALGVVSAFVAGCSGDAAEEPATTATTGAAEGEGE